MKKLFLLLSILGFQANAQCWEQIDAGGFFVVGIKDNGTLWGWGRAWSGELGVSQYDFYAAEPVQIGNDSDWASVSTGNGHVMALKTDGTLWTWGRNDCGQLGDGNVTIYMNATPQQIGTDTWSSISAGHIHSTAIKSDGTLWTWGSNISGQLGNGLVDTIIAETIVPTQVGMDTNWGKVCASSDNTAAIKTDGTLWVTGEGNHGEIGNGQWDDQLQFIQAGDDTDWYQVAVGGLAVTALKSDGTLWSWGFNFSGGLGIGTNTDSAVPTLINTDRWTSINRGMNYFAGAIKADGTLWTWGYNYYGPVGDGTTENRNAPTLVSSEAGWLSYAGAGDYSIGLTESGELRVWGYNWYGELGFDLEGNTVLSPVTVEDCDGPTADVEEASLTDFAIYPNPVKDVLNINLKGHTLDNLTVTDVAGKTVLEQSGNATQVNVQHLPAGMYFLRLSTGNHAYNHKFVKE